MQLSSLWQVTQVQLITASLKKLEKLEEEEAKLEMGFFPLYKLFSILVKNISDSFF